MKKLQICWFVLLVLSFFTNGVFAEGDKERTRHFEITSVPVLSIQKGVDFIYDIKTTKDGTKEKVKYRLLQSPERAILNYHTGQIKWSPIGFKFGEYTFEILAKYKNKRAKQVFVVEYKIRNIPPKMLSEPELNAYVNHEYIYRIKHVDQNSNELTLDLIEAPEGMFTKDNSLRWTPNVNQTGEHIITLKVDDQKGGTDTQSFIIQTEFLFGIPPDPEEAGNLSVRGIDIDNDGIRDDIENKVFSRYPTDERKRRFLFRLAKTVQNAIEGMYLNDEAAIHRAFQEGRVAIRCMFKVFPRSGIREEIAFVVKAAGNTPQRNDLYMRYNDYFDGVVLTSKNYRNPLSCE